MHADLLDIKVERDVYAYMHVCIYASRNKINIYSCVHVRAYMHIET
jgi:hypothetical protein